MVCESIWWYNLRQGRRTTEVVIDTSGYYLVPVTDLVVSEWAKRFVGPHLEFTERGLDSISKSILDSLSYYCDAFPKVKEGYDWMSDDREGKTLIPLFALYDSQTNHLKFIFDDGYDPDVSFIIKRFDGKEYEYGLHFTLTMNSSDLDDFSVKSSPESKLDYLFSLRSLVNVCQKGTIRYNK